MRTLIIQSYRTAAVALWLRTCMGSVRRWAQEMGFDYSFVDDRLFTLVPAWYRRKCGAMKLPVTDLARLLAIRLALREKGYDRAVWIDADVLVFDPRHFSVEHVRDCAFANEYWISEDPEGRLQGFHRINNSVLGVCRTSPMLDFLIHAIQRIVARRAPEKLTHISAGTALLTRLARAMPLETIHGAGSLSPLVISELVAGRHRCAKMLAEGRRLPLGAVNLCASMAERPEALVRDADLERAVQLLMGSRGEPINRWIPAMAPLPT